ncbi:hypothetical protein AS593_21060 [Caulobacter vibrioides]|nr:hypothetical protein AS593_21060 [Caulobacter vibrioides]
MVTQELRCAYCNSFFATGVNMSWDIDHILCRAKYPDLFLEPDNFVLSCKECNGAKSDKDVLHTHHPRPLKHVPQPTDAYDIPHARKTSWTTHVSHVAYLVYMGKSTQGWNLIDVCDLNRKAEIAAGQPVGAVKVAIEEKLFASWDIPLPQGSTVTQEVAAYGLKREKEIELQAAPIIAELNKKTAAAEAKARRATEKLARETGAQPPPPT